MTWTPGEGWREVRYSVDTEGHECITWESTGMGGGMLRTWVRDKFSRPSSPVLNGSRDQWHEVDQLRADENGMEIRMRKDGAKVITYWKENNVVPPLPTEPYTVIRVTWRSRATEVLLLEDGRWLAEREIYSDADVAGDITGFEVLAVPVRRRNDHWLADINTTEERVRRETAKVILDRVEELWPGDVAHSVLRDEFGVES